MNTVPTIKTSAVITADISITSSAALQSVGLVSTIAANSTQHVIFWIPFNVGATGGVRAKVVVPTVATVIIESVTLFNNVAPSITTRVIVTMVNQFADAVANAGISWLQIEATVFNGSNSGNVDLQMAQNTSDPLTLTVKQGGFLQVTKF